MQAIFTSIIAGDEQAVRDRIAKDPSAVAAVATGQPKKYAGQSTLQVAIRSGQFAIGRLLLSLGADPAFVDEGSPTGWSAPVLHDAVAAAVTRSRWLRPGSFADPESDWRIANSEETADAAFAMLVEVLDAGADAQALDSKGNSALGRAAGAARDVLPRHNYTDPDRSEAKPVNPELVDDLTRIFHALISRGADPHRMEKQLGQPLADFYAAEPVGRFLIDH